jgi:hypothetical protein
MIFYTTGVIWTILIIKKQQLLADIYLFGTNLIYFYQPSPREKGTVLDIGN